MRIKVKGTKCGMLLFEVQMALSVQLLLFPLVFLLFTQMTLLSNHLSSRFALRKAKRDVAQLNRKVFNLVLLSKKSRHTWIFAKKKLPTPIKHPLTETELQKIAIKTGTVIKVTLHQRSLSIIEFFPKYKPLPRRKKILLDPSAKLTFSPSLMNKNYLFALKFTLKTKDRQNKQGRHKR